MNVNAFCKYFHLACLSMFWFTFVVQTVLVGHFIKIMHLLTELHIEFPCFMFLHGYFTIYVFASQFSVIALEALSL